jgi:hypothetical protein
MRRYNCQSTGPYFFFDETVSHPEKWRNYTVADLSNRGSNEQV